jgi:hypothetical protein
LVKFIDAPTVWHCTVKPSQSVIAAPMIDSRSGEVHIPLAHARFPLPQEVPIQQRQKESRIVRETHRFRSLGRQDSSPTCPCTARPDRKSNLATDDRPTESQLRQRLEQTPHLRARRKLARAGTTRAGRRVAHRTTLELARGAVAAGRVGTHARVAVCTHEHGRIHEAETHLRRLRRCRFRTFGAKWFVWRYRPLGGMSS